MRPSRATRRRAILERDVVQCRTLQDPDYARAVAAGLQYRSVLAVPMLRDGGLSGRSRSRRESAVHRHADRLLETFADQAVIAIENARLFEELEAQPDSRGARAADGDGRGARVIASPTDLHPVLDAIVESAARLCEARDGVPLP